MQECGDGDVLDEDCKDKAMESIRMMKIAELESKQDSGRTKVSFLIGQLSSCI